MEFIEVTENSRTYIFPNGQQIVVEDVERVCVRPSGTHRLETADGTKVIIPTGWLALEIDSDEDWYF